MMHYCSVKMRSIAKILLSYLLKATAAVTVVSVLFATGTKKMLRNMVWRLLANSQSMGGAMGGVGASRTLHTAQPLLFHLTDPVYLFIYSLINLNFTIDSRTVE